MFQWIVIKLGGPICSCRKQNLSWSIYLEQNRPGLTVSCISCKTEVRVPPGKLTAAFQLEKEYPEGAMANPGSSRVTDEDKIFLKDLGMSLPES